MSLESAQGSFLSLVQTLDSSVTREHFFRWLRENLDEAEAASGGDGVAHATLVEARRNLSVIAQDLRFRLPAPESVLPSETVTYPPGLSRLNSIYLDAFLYDEEDGDKLVEEGKLTRAFCRDCGSKNTEMLEFVTPSISQPLLERLFARMLPPLANRCVLSIGCRFGAVLFGAALFSQASSIIGVERNADLSRICAEAIARHGLDSGGRVKVICAELTTLPEMVSQANVVVLDSTFEWFCGPDPSTEERVWAFLKAHLSPGTIVAVALAPQGSSSKLLADVSVLDWMMELNPALEEEDDFGVTSDDSSDIHIYQVKPK